MDYEKKYKEVLKKIREGLQPSPDGTKISGVTREFLEEVFPELAESEDEKIRKALVRFHKSTIDIDGIKGADILAWIEKQGKQKPAWSEEDKDFMYDTLSNLTELKDRYGEGYGNVGKCINWLKSIKDRVQPKPQQKWSEEDENMANDLIEGLLSSEKTHYLVHTSKEIVDWLKSIKDRMQGKEEKK